MRVTISDLSKATGLSKSTISGVLNNKSGFSRKTREKVFQAAKELGYVPNEIAIGLSSKSTRTIGLIIKDITNPYYNQLTKGVQEVASEHGFTVFLCSSGEDQKAEVEHIRVMERKRVDGIIIAPLLEEVSFVHFFKLKQRGVPFVLLGEIEGLECDYVKFDDYDGGLQVMDHLLDYGHRRIAYIKGPRTSRSSKERFQAYCDKLKESGITPDPKIVFDNPADEESVLSIARTLTAMHDKPTAVVCFDDMIAVQFIKAFQKLGVRVPDDISLVGFDDIEWVAFPLTSVSIPTYEAGKMLAEALFSRIMDTGAEYLQHTFKEKLMIRSSVKPL